MRIVAAGKEHLDALASLNAEVQDLHIGFAPGIFKPPCHDEIAALFEVYLEDKNRKTFICYEHDQPVGYISLQIGGHEGHALCYPQKWVYIDHIGVTEKFRGTGVGKKLIETARDFARNNNINRIMLDVWRLNENARRFFKKQGFDTVIEKMAMEVQR